MPRIPQGIGGLIENGIAGHEPQYDRMVGSHEIMEGQPCGITCKQSLTTACWHAKANVRHSRLQPRNRHWKIRRSVAKHTSSDLTESMVRISVACYHAKEVAQRVKYPCLIIL